MSMQKNEFVELFERLQDQLSAYEKTHGHKPDALALTKEDAKSEITLFANVPVLFFDAKATEFIKMK